MYVFMVVNLLILLVLLIGWWGPGFLLLTDENVVKPLDIQQKLMAKHSNVEQTCEFFTI